LAGPFISGGWGGFGGGGAGFVVVRLAVGVAFGVAGRLATPSGFPRTLLHSRTKSLKLGKLTQSSFVSNVLIACLSDLVFMVSRLRKTQLSKVDVKSVHTINSRFSVSRYTPGLASASLIVLGARAGRRI
tara:strand:- start:454 stop:843 length:390 start_codon:yes stop_codon:yes gene_type:complete